MWHPYDAQWENTDNERNRSTKSRKNKNAGKKKNAYSYLGILEVNTIKQAEMKEKNKKKEPQKNEKTSRKQALQ